MTLDEVTRSPAPLAPSPDEAAAIVEAYESAPTWPRPDYRNVDGQDKLVGGGWVITAGDYLRAKTALVARAIALEVRPEPVRQTRQTSISVVNDRLRDVVDALASIDPDKTLSADAVLNVPWVIKWLEGRKIDEATVRKLINERLPKDDYPRRPGRPPAAAAWDVPRLKLAKE